MNKRLRLRKLGSHGDTIVEVLIATAIASLVLVSAYAITTRNTRATQDAQENSYAQKLVEQQIELLRQNPAVATVDGCFDTSTDAHEYTAGTCAVAVPGNGAQYTVSIQRTSPPVATLGARYYVQVTWQTLNNAQAKVTAHYAAERT
jgi:Tfp pilus assembly protein PilV